MSLQLSLRILDGTLVERLQLGNKECVATQKMSGYKLHVGLTKTPTVRNSERSKFKRKRKVDNVVGMEDVVTETLEDLTEASPVRKKKRTHGSLLDSREKRFDHSDNSVLEAKSDMPSYCDRLNTAKEKDSSQSIRAGVGEAGAAGEKVLAGEDPLPSGQGLKKSLKTMSRGQSGVVAVKEVGKRSEQKDQRGWDPGIAGGHQFGSGQSSTWT